MSKSVGLRRSLTCAQFDCSASALFRCSGPRHGRGRPCHEFPAFVSKPSETETPSPPPCLIFVENQKQLTSYCETAQSHRVSFLSHAPSKRTLAHLQRGAICADNAGHKRTFFPDSKRLSVSECPDERGQPSPPPRQRGDFGELSRAEGRGVGSNLGPHPVL